MDRNEIFLRIVRGAPPNALTVPELSPDEWAACQPLIGDGTLDLTRQQGATYIHAVSFAAAAEALADVGEIDIPADVIRRLAEREGRDAFEHGERLNTGWPDLVQAGWRKAKAVAEQHGSAARSSE